MFVENDNEKDRIIILDIKEIIPNGSICLVTKKDRALSIAARELANMLCKAKSDEKF